MVNEILDAPVRRYLPKTKYPALNFCLSGIAIFFFFQVLPMLLLRYGILKESMTIVMVILILALGISIFLGLVCALLSIVTALVSLGEGSVFDKLVNVGAVLLTLASVIAGAVFVDFWR